MLQERVPERVPVKVERKLERSGTQTERKWNANGTHFRTRSGRVPNAFSVRLFLNSTVLQIQRIALQRNDDLRQQFKAEKTVFSPNQLVFLNETGIVRIKERSIPLS